MNPKSRRLQHFLLPAQGEQKLVLAPGHRVHRLAANAAWIYENADGTRTVQELALGLAESTGQPVNVAVVFELLDALADNHLLESRIAPPAGISRRGVVATLSRMAAIVALTAALGSSADVLAANSDAVCTEERVIIDEIAWLEAQETAVADQLDEWVQEAAAAGDEDVYYLEALSAREEKRKDAALRLQDELEDASFDLASCQMEEKALPRLSQREQEAKSRLRKRSQEQDAKVQHAKERHNKSTVRLSGRESEQKAGISQKEAERKRSLASAEDKEKSLSAAESRTKDSKMLSEERQKSLDTRYAVEERAKADRRLRLEQRSEEVQKQVKVRLLSSEERTKRHSEAYTLRQQEEVVKDPSLTDVAKKVAMEEQIKARETAKRDRQAAEEHAKQGI